MKRLLGILLLLPACGGTGPVLTVAGNGSRESARMSARAALEADPGITVVFAHSEELGLGAAAAAERAGLSGISILAVGDRPEPAGLAAGLSAVVEDPTGAAEAVDLAVLAFQEAALPRELPLGTRIWTAGNLGSGGEELPFVGSLALDSLRPETPVPEAAAGRIGVIPSEGSRAARVLAELRARAAEHPGVLVEVGEGEAVTAVRGLVRRGCKAIVIDLHGAGVPREAARAGLEAGIPVILLGGDPTGTEFTTWIHGDHRALGRAAGRWAAARRGEGRVLEITGPWTPAVRERSSGFSEAFETPGRR